MMRLIRTYSSEAEAHMARGMLASHGIEATVHRFSRYRAIASGGWLLRVTPRDYEKAERLLGKKSSGPDMDEYVDPEDTSYRRCPQCRSVNVQAQPMPPVLQAAAVMTLGLLLLFVPRDWSCAKCGHEWRSR